MIDTRATLHHHALFDADDLRAAPAATSDGRLRELAAVVRRPVAGPSLGEVRRLGEALGLKLEVEDETLAWTTAAGEPASILVQLRPAGAPLAGIERDEWLRGNLVSPPVQLWRRLRDSGLAWGVVTDGRRLRLQHRDSPPDHHLTIELGSAEQEDAASLALAATLLAGRRGSGQLRDRWWMVARQRRERVVRVAGRELARRAVQASVSPLERWCFLAWLGSQPGGEELGDALAVLGDGPRGRIPAALGRRIVALGWTSAAANDLLAPVAVWWSTEGQGEIAALSDRLGEDATTAIGRLDVLSFARLWEGRRRSGKIAQDGAFWRLAAGRVGELAQALDGTRDEILGRLGAVQRQVEHGPVTIEVREHFAHRLRQQRELFSGLSVLDLHPGRGYRLVAWVEQAVEAVLASPGYTSPWLEAEVVGEVEGLRASIRRGLYAVLPVGGDPARVAIPLAAVAPGVPWPEQSHQVVAGDWLAAAALPDLARPLASKRPRAGQADLFEHVFRDQLRMLRADFLLLSHGRGGDHLPTALLRTEERVRLGADVVNAWLAGEPIPWSGVEQVVAQIRGAGANGDLTSAPWCERARRWAVARGLLYLELAFPERLLEEGRLGFDVVVGGEPVGVRAARQARRRVHDLLTPGGTACWCGDTGGVRRLDELVGAEPASQFADDAGRTVVWHRRDDENRPES
jgi:hypothetical protein